MSNLAKSGAGGKLVLNLLMDPSGIKRHHLSDEALEENARMLESVLDDYGVKGEIVSVRPGPVVTMYELEPAPGLKASRVIGLADDIAFAAVFLASDEGSFINSHDLVVDGGRIAMFNEKS